jgi:PAS domain-containing protein
VHPDDLPRVSRSLKDHLDGCSSTFRCEYRLRCRDGSWLWNFDRGRVIARDPITALPLRMVGTASDITHIKAAQQVAEAASQRLELAQANAGVGLWDLDLETGAVRFCERSRAMHGLGSEGPLTLTREEWSATVHDADRAQAVRKLRDYIESGETYRIRYRTIGPDGVVRWVMGMGKAVPGHDGRPDRFVGLNLEITALSALMEPGDGIEMAAGDVPPRAAAPVEAEGISVA